MIFGKNRTGRNLAFLVLVAGVGFAGGRYTATSPEPQEIIPPTHDLSIEISNFRAYIDITSPKYRGLVSEYGESDAKTLFLGYMHSMFADIAAPSLSEDFIRLNIEVARKKLDLIRERQEKLDDLEDTSKGFERRNTT